MQEYLLVEAERMLGPRRDPTKIIYQPVFVPDGPRIRNTPDLLGAFAELSMNAARYWPTVVYELAHETVHLLDPKIGYANWLEEGIAVEFSIRAQLGLGLIVQTPDPGVYEEALSLVRCVFNEPLEKARYIRTAMGGLGLGDLVVQDLQAQFPEVDIDLLTKLTIECIPR